MGEGNSVAARVFQIRPRRYAPCCQPRFASYTDAALGFWQSPTYFGPVSEMLLNQLKRATEVPSIDELTASITDLAVAADSAAHQKTINTAVLGYMRSNDPVVRLTAVKCQESLAARLGEEWLVLLPEMLPFISELQEDDDKKVERETLKWIKKIEDMLGESLTPML